MNITVKPIHSEKDHTAALSRIDELWGSKRGTHEGNELEILFVLVEAYEKEHYPIPPPTLEQAIEFYMDQQGISRSALAKILGSKSRVSELLSGKRKPSVRMMKILHRELGVPADVLLAD